MEPIEETVRPVDEVITVTHYIATLRELAAAGKWSPGKKWVVSDARRDVTARFGKGGNGNHTSEWKEQAIAAVTAELTGAAVAAVSAPSKACAPLPPELMKKLEAFDQNIRNSIMELDSSLSIYLDGYRADVDADSAGRIEAVKCDADARVEELQGECNAAMVMVGDYEEKINALQAEVTDKTTQVDKAVGHIEALTDKLREKEQKLSEQEKQFVEANKKTGQQEEHIKLLELSNDEKQKDIEALRYELETIKKTESEATGKATALEKQVISFEKQAANHQLRMTELDATLSATKEAFVVEVATANGKSSALEVQVAGLVKQVAELESVLSSTREDAAKEAGKNEALQQQIVAYQTSLEGTGVEDQPIYATVDKPSKPKGGKK